MTLADLFSFGFMQRALIAALISGLLCPAVGAYIVQRRLSLLGDGLGHVAIAGVGLAMLTGTAPMPVAIVICLVGALAIELLRQRGHATADVGLAILFYGGISVGLLLAGLAGQGAGTLSQYLFGSLITVTTGDIGLIIGLAVVVLVVGIGLSPQLFSVCVDEDYARTQGLPVRLLNLMIVAMAAITVTLSMRTVGLLLVSALMVVPVAAAQNLAGSFRATIGIAMAIGVVVGGGGTLISAAADTPSGPTIVVSAIVLFALAAGISAIQRRRHPKVSDVVEPTIHHVVAEVTDHAGSAAPAVLHDDHVDYLFGGHRHAPHGDHYDEH
ncbi:MAG: metal ABC transporter permease [Propionibacteriaceae bacterium]|nr:metal ABC transporter permease [Propionibacteriaceae bacterium]